MFTKLTYAMFVAVPLALGATTYAVAHPGSDGAGKGHKMLQKFDANGDGALDDAERAQMKTAFQAKRAARKQAQLAKYDADRSGSLDDAERAAMRDDKLAKKFAKLDVNGDGAISLDELKAGADQGLLGRHGRHGHGFHRTPGMKL